MTGFEIFGVLLAGIMTLFAVVLTMLGAEAAKRRQIADAILHLRWSGIMTFSSFVLMVSLIYKCEVICWVAKNQEGQNRETSAEQIANQDWLVADTPIVEYISEAGVEVKWPHYTAAVRSVPSIHRRSSGNNAAD